MFFTITVSGQLLLSMLCEMLTEGGFQVLSANTDGVTVRVKKNKLREYYNICKLWEKKSRMSLEYSLFSKIIRRDVNCYYAVSCDKDGVPTGKVKEKGSWSRGVKLGKGFDKPVVQEALYNYFIHGIPPAETIYNHKDIYDFCASQRVGKQYRVEYCGKPTQRLNRYYVTNSVEGGELFKIKHISGQKTSLLAGQNVMLFNNYLEQDDYRIDYNYYLRVVNEIIAEVEQNQLTLF
jgi:hypothetical protein